MSRPYKSALSKIKLSDLGLGRLKFGFDSERGSVATRLESRVEVVDLSVVLKS